MNSVRYLRICSNPVLHVSFSYGMVLYVQYGDNCDCIVYVSSFCHWSGCGMPRLKDHTGNWTLSHEYKI